MSDVASSKTGPVVLITGCSSGIGRALAEAFHAAGCRVHATARNPDSLRGLAEQGIAIGRLDVTDADSIAASVRQVEADSGGIDMLVNNDGVPLMGPTAEIALDELRRVWETNITGLVAVTQAVVPGMASRGRGRIVNIGSVSGILTTPFAGPYCASKAAVHSLSEAMRMELAPFGIDVNVVQPGGIESRFGDSAKSQVGTQQWTLYADHARAIARRAGASQDNATPTTVFASAMVKAVLVRNPKPIIRIGAGSRLLPALAGLPIRFRHRMLMRRFGLGG